MGSGRGAARRSRSFLRRSPQAGAELIRLPHREYEEVWRDEVGELHRDDGPARLVCLRDGSVVLEEYRQHGKLHRVDGPAVVEMLQNGTREERFYLDGVPKREDGPTAIRYYWGDNVSEERWLDEDGELHREDGPAGVTYAWDVYNHSTREEFYAHGVHRQQGGPSEIQRSGDGNVISEAYYDDERRRHREDGPAYTEYDKRGQDVVVNYYRHGKLHREDGPAQFSRYPDGTIERERYCLEGKEHRIDGPALVEFYPDGTPSNERYMQHGVPHNPEGPAWTEYYENGKASISEYRINGKLHREDGPASIKWHKNGKVSREVYATHDVPHREDGPAEIEYDLAGDVSRERYLLHGREVSKAALQMDPDELEDGTPVSLHENGVLGTTGPEGPQELEDSSFASTR